MSDSEPDTDEIVEACVGAYQTLARLELADAMTAIWMVFEQMLLRTPREKRAAARAYMADIVKNGGVGPGAKANQERRH